MTVWNNATRIATVTPKGITIARIHTAMTAVDIVMIVTDIRSIVEMIATEMGGNGIDDTGTGV